jgi:hypothetical protein
MMLDQRLERRNRPFQVLELDLSCLPDITGT